MHNVDNNASDNEMLSYLKQDLVYKSPWTEGRNVCWPCSYTELSAIPNYPRKRRLFTCSFPRHDRQTQNHCFTLSKMDMASISVTGKSVWSSVTTGYTTQD